MFCVTRRDRLAYWLRVLALRSDQVVQSRLQLSAAFGAAMFVHLREKSKIKRKMTAHHTNKFIRFSYCQLFCYFSFSDVYSRLSVDLAATIELFGILAHLPIRFWVDQRVHQAPNVQQDHIIRFTLCITTPICIITLHARETLIFLSLFAFRHFEQPSLVP